MQSIERIFGDRLAVRELPEPLPAGIVLPENAHFERKHFTAEVVMVGNRLSEEVKAGDRVMVQIHHDTHHPGAGDTKAIHNGEVVRMISTKAVVGIL